MWPNKDVANESIYVFFENSEIKLKPFISFY